MSTLFLLGVLLPAGSTAYGQQPDDIVVSQEALWQLLADTQAELTVLEQQPAAAQAAYLRNVAAQIEQITAVARADGSTLPLSLTALAAEMRAEDPDLSRLDSRLQALLDARSELETAVFSNSDTQPLTEILQQEAYQYDREPSWLQQRWQTLLERLDNWLLENFPAWGITAGDIFGYLLVFVSTIVLVVVLSYLLSDLFADFVSDATLLDADEAGVPLTADTALQRAQTLSTEGDYRTAVRYLYLSALLLLEERGLLRYDRSLTNREYLRLVAHRPDLAAILADVVDVFDRVWYGYQPLEGEAYEHYQLQVETLKRQRAS